MKPLNIKDRSKAFLKVVGLFLICFAIAMILGFTTMNAGRLTDSASNKDLKELRENNFSASEAIEAIRSDYPYLQFDSIRKIIYLGNKRAV